MIYFIKNFRLLVAAFLTMFVLSFSLPPIDTEASELPVTQDYSLKLSMNASVHVLTTHVYTNNVDTPQYSQYALIQEIPSHGALYNYSGDLVQSGDTIDLPDFFTGLTYTPENDFHGADRFTFRIHNGEHYSNVSSYNFDIISDNHFDDTVTHDEDHGDSHNNDSGYVYPGDDFVCEAYQYQCAGPVGGGGDDSTNGGSETNFGSGGGANESTDNESEDWQGGEEFTGVGGGSGESTPLIRSGGRSSSPQLLPYVILSVFMSFIYTERVFI